MNHLFSLKALPLIAQSRGHFSDHLEAASFHCLSIPPLEARSSCGSEHVAPWCALRAGAAGRPPGGEQTPSWHRLMPQLQPQPLGLEQTRPEPLCVPGTVVTVRMQERITQFPSCGHTRRGGVRISKTTPAAFQGACIPGDIGPSSEVLRLSLECVW